MPERINTISESIAGICRIREKLTAVSGRLDDQFDKLETLFNDLQDGVIDIGRLSPDEVATLTLCLVEAYSARFIRRFEQDLICEISMRN